MKCRLVWLALLSSCSHPPGSVGGPPEHPVAAAAEYCDIAVAALRETIKSNADQPYGLEDACVRRLASLAGRTYVDARLAERTVGRETPQSCIRAPFVIRFDAQAFQPSPAEGVVFLSISALKDDRREFNAIVEESNWPARRPEVLAVSPCGSAFGTISRVSTGWTARVAPPPRSPDAF